MLFCKYFLYYYEDNFDSNIEASRAHLLNMNENPYLFDRILKDIYK